MATIALATSQKSPSEKGNEASRYQICAGLAANTSQAFTYYTVPGDGIIKSIIATTSVTSDGTKTYAFVVTNDTAGKTVASAQTWDDSPVATAGTPVTVVVSTTAADVAVTKGDVIKLGFTGGSGSGTASVIIDVEITA